MPSIGSADPDGISDFLEVGNIVTNIAEVGLQQAQQLDALRRLWIVQILQVVVLLGVICHYGKRFLHKVLRPFRVWNYNRQVYYHAGAEEF